VNKIQEVSGLIIMNDFVCNRGNFKVDALFYRKPVKSDKSWSDMVRTFNRWENGTGKRVLDKLQTIEGSIRKIIEKGVAVVKIGVDKRIG